MHCRKERYSKIQNREEGCFSVHRRNEERVKCKHFCLGLGTNYGAEHRREGKCQEAGTGSFY